MHRPHAAAWGIVSCLCLAAVASAGNFRIETEVFVPPGDKPASRTLTLYSDGVVYDFSLADSSAGGIREIAILDLARQQFTLLDPARQAKTEFACKELAEFNRELQQLAQRSGKKLYQFAADPKFAENYARQGTTGGTLTLTSGVIDYRVSTTRAPQPEVAAEYAEATDWYTRLNTIHPGSLPPFHRLHLNAVLMKHGVLPTRVERTIFQGNQRGQTVRSEHRVEWVLSARDRQMIDQTRTPRVEYKPLSFAEYHVVPEKK